MQGDPPPAEKKSPKQVHDPRELGLVYANPLASNAITRELKQFPEGSILVREKLSDDDK